MIMIKLEIKLKKDEVFHHFLDYYMYTASEKFIFYDELNIFILKLC